MTAAPDHRRRELAQIHIAKKQLGMDDATYRDMLWACARVRSSGDLDYAGRQRVLEHLKRCGFAPARPAAGNAEWGWIDRAPEEKRKMLRKIAAMLRAAGRGRSYLEGTQDKPGMIKRMFNVERLEFCAPDQLHKIVSALTFDARRRM